MTDRPVELWLFYPDNSPSLARKAKQIIRAECEKRQWTFQDRPTHLIKPNGRPIGRVRPEDATNLYKRIHRARVGVWQIENANVPQRPQPRNTTNDYITLGRFVCHKAYHSRLPKNSIDNAWISSLEGFPTWVKGIDCENEGDPRCLSLHVFDTRFEVGRLTCQDGRERFAGIHGAQSSRLDEKGLKWTRGAFHGHETLQVAGRELTTGFHWDVEGKPKQRIITTSDVWEFKPNGYVNVYPDAYIRRTSKAKRVFP